MWSFNLSVFAMGCEGRVGRVGNARGARVETLCNFTRMYLSWKYHINLNKNHSSCP